MQFGVDKDHNSFLILQMTKYTDGTYQQYITNDTLINGEIYNKLEENGVFEWEDYPIPLSSGSSTYFHQYVGCIREDDTNSILRTSN